jgi:hypothetical protein
MDLARLGQRQQQPELGAFDGQPAGFPGAFARRLKPVGQAQLKFA